MKKILKYFITWLVVLIICYIIATINEKTPDFRQWSKSTTETVTTVNIITAIIIFFL